MDVERKISKIEIEADIDNNFEDAVIFTKDKKFYCQMKDINTVLLSDIKFDNKKININGKDHTLSNDINIIFFKNISFTSNSQLFGLPAFKKSNVYIISLSREEINSEIKKIYKSNEKRTPTILSFFEKCFDERRITIIREDLPIIEIFNTKLLEPTINIGKYCLEINNLLLIEGKPGVGKSHLVNCIIKDYHNYLLYRFWISNQDKDYKERLMFNNFISNISKELFNDLVFRSEDEIINAIEKKGKSVIIDGLDHIENYNNEELQHYLDFFNKLKIVCKTIILSRPLQINTNWEKQVLTNWTKEQTLQVLDELHITDYTICSSIFEITDGYPILVRYISEHFKIFNELPLIEELKDLEDYYNAITKDVKMKSSLSLFISSRSFFMKSEIYHFLDIDFAQVVNEFIQSYPYVFDIKLNRIALFHDSFNTYLKNQILDNTNRINRINNIVFKSIMSGEKKFLSRFSYFYLDHSMKLKIIKKYASIKEFEILLKHTIDFEAIRSFYNQIREILSELKPEDLTIIDYYDLSLILNIVNRDHVSTLNTFFYTYVKSLLFHGYKEDDITSSEYLFAMLFYIKTNDISLLYNITSNNNYSTDNFYQNLLSDIDSEENYFNKHQTPIKFSKHIKDIFSNDSEYQIKDAITFIIENLYINGTSEVDFFDLHSSIKNYIEVDLNVGISQLENILAKHKVRSFFAKTILNKAKENIESLGEINTHNKYSNISLFDYIHNNNDIGSFKMWVEILNHIRLSLHQKRKIDIESISFFWPMYHERKDYSVINLDVALKVFEDTGFISIDDSIKLIMFTQNMSEKGIRHLLNSYIILHTPEILDIFEHKFDLEDLRISWFDLPGQFIEAFSDKIFHYAMNELLRQYSYSKEIYFEEIENVYNTNKWAAMLKIIKITKYKIRIPKTHPLAFEISDLNVPIEIVSSDDHISKSTNDSKDRYEKGILDSDDIEFIKENNLTAVDISGYSDGNYSHFSDIDIYKIYNSEDIKNNTQLILFNALQGKIRSINMFGNLYYFVGNVPKFIIDHDIDEDINTAFNSFNKFLELSLLISKR
jgi:hypothetical protein